MPQNECLECGTATKGKFCTKSHSASYNNRSRKHTAETKKKISDALSGTTHRRGNHKQVQMQERKCTVCGQKFITPLQRKRKTCSEDCTVEAKVRSRSYRNGRRLLTEYECKYNNTKVWLESSWEVQIAQALDHANIQWYRPNPLTWFDKKGKTRKYYSDFYLPNQAIYVDPKNPYCMEQDREKMAAIKQVCQIVYGDVSSVLHSLSRITGRKLI